MKGKLPRGHPSPPHHHLPNMQNPHEPFINPLVHCLLWLFYDITGTFCTTFIKSVHILHFPFAEKGFIKHVFSSCNIYIYYFRFCHTKFNNALFFPVRLIPTLFLTLKSPPSPEEKWRCVNELHFRWRECPLSEDSSRKGRFRGVFKEFQLKIDYFLLCNQVFVSKAQVSSEVQSSK